MVIIRGYTYFKILADTISLVIFMANKYTTLLCLNELKIKASQQFNVQYVKCVFILRFANDCI